MIRCRAYSTARGCGGRRLLDYVSPETHSVVPRAHWLLTARTGARYQNGLSNFNDRLELLTVLALLLRTEEGKPALKQSLLNRLGLKGSLTAFRRRYLEGEDVFGAVLQQNKSSLAELECWLQCVCANSLGEALGIIASRPTMRWPDFVLLYTFGRKCQSPLEAYNAVRQFQRLLPAVQPHLKPEMLVLMVRIAQKQLVDLVPIAVRVYLNTSPALSGAVLNELIWQIARFGTNWSATDTPLLLEAQELLVQRAGVSLVDAKGIFGLAYITHFQHPTASNRAMTELGPIVSDRTPPAQQSEFAYTCGPLAIRILTAETPEDALLAMDTASKHLPMLWTCLCLYLSRSRLLTRDMALRILRKLGQSKIRFTGLLAEILLGAVKDLNTKRSIVDSVLRERLQLTPALAAKMLSVSTVTDLQNVLGSTYMIPYLRNQRVLQQQLDTQSRIDQGNAWNTYVRLCQVAVPSRAALRCLCRAAWDPSLLWDGIYAPQRAVVEVKKHVRGAVAPADDLMRVYPDERMLYNYVVMIGRAGYTEELLSFLSWMDAINFTPTKRILLALIHYSPQGPALLKLGQKTRPPHSEWPTEEEYELYAQQH